MTIAEKIQELLERRNVRQFTAEFEGKSPVRLLDSPKFAVLPHAQFIDAEYVARLESVVRLVPELAETARLAPCNERIEECQTCAVMYRICAALDAALKQESGE